MRELTKLLHAIIEVDSQVGMVLPSKRFRQRTKLVIIVPRWRLHSMGRLQSGQTPEQRWFWCECQTPCSAAAKIEQLYQ
ncbi:unnamed protein product [Urochloa humidicola]